MTTLNYQNLDFQLSNIKKKDITIRNIISIQLAHISSVEGKKRLTKEIEMSDLTKNLPKIGPQMMYSMHLLKGVAGKQIQQIFLWSHQAYKERPGRNITKQRKQIV